MLGYLDGDLTSFVSDRIMRQSMVKTLTAPCAKNNLVRACGFSAMPDDGDIFEKKVENPKGQMQKVRLHLTASSHSPSDAVNRGQSDKQAIQTAIAEKTFFDGICEADTLIYAGHARHGGGPDFSPAKRRADGTTDFQYYEDKGPGLTKLDQAFERATANCGEKRPKIMGMFGCNSEIWRGRL